MTDKHDFSVLYFFEKLIEEAHHLLADEHDADDDTIVKALLESEAATKLANLALARARAGG